MPWNTNDFSTLSIFCHVHLICYGHNCGEPVNIVYNEFRMQYRLSDKLSEIIPIQIVILYLWKVLQYQIITWACFSCFSCRWSVIQIYFFYEKVILNFCNDVLLFSFLLIYYYISRELFGYKIFKNDCNKNEIFCESFWLHKIKFNS